MFGGDVKDAEPLVAICSDKTGEELCRKPHCRCHDLGEGYPDRVVARDRPFVRERRPTAANRDRQAFEACPQLRRSQIVKRVAEVVRRFPVEEGVGIRREDVPVSLLSEKLEHGEIVGENADAPQPRQTGAREFGGCLRARGEMREHVYFNPGPESLSSFGGTGRLEAEGR